MSTSWLIDKSALSRLSSRPDAQEWANQIERGLARSAASPCSRPASLPVGPSRCPQRWGHHRSRPCLIAEITGQPVERLHIEERTRLTHGCRGHSEQLDGARGSRRPSKSAVTGQQRRVQGLGQRDVSGVVGREIVPQFPAAGQQRDVRGSMHRQGREVGQREVRPADVDTPCTVLTTQNRNDLQVDQLRRGQCLTAKAGSSGISVRAVISQRDRKDARVNDEHDPPVEP